MSSRGWTAAALAALCVLGAGFSLRGRSRGDQPPAPGPQPEVRVTPEGTSDDVAWANTLQEGAPDSRTLEASFRKGHVSPKPLPEGSIAQRPGRFEVVLPSGAPITTPAVHRGRVVFSGGFHGKELYAVDAKTGAFAWGAALDDDGPSAPACADGVCVFNTESCTVFALDVATGEQKWSFWMGDPMLSAPAIAGGLAFTSYPLGAGIPTNQMFDNNSWNNIQQQAPAQPPVQPSAQTRASDASHAVVALDLHTGAVKWHRRVDGDIVSAPVASKDALSLTTFSGSVFTLAQSDGALRAVVRGRATSAPTVVGGDMFWSARSDAQGSAREQLLQADAASGQTKLRYAEKEAPYLDKAVQSTSGYNAQSSSLDASNGFGGGAPSTAKAAVALDNVGQGTVAGLQRFQGSRIANSGDNNFATMGDEVVCTDAKTGAVRWKRSIDGDLSAGGSLATSPALAGGKIIVGTLDGKLLVLDPETGKTERSIEIGHPIRSQPAIEGGWAYVGTEDGRLVGVDLDDPALTGWPMWGGDAARSASRM